MTTQYKETEAFEISPALDGGIDIEFRCPACKDDVIVEFNDGNDAFVTCVHCNASHHVQLRLVIEWTPGD